MKSLPLLTLCFCGLICSAGAQQISDGFPGAEAIIDEVLQECGLIEANLPSGIVDDIASAEQLSPDGDQLTDAASSSTNTAGYAVVSREANARVWEKNQEITGPGGKVITVKNRYAEIASGLHYRYQGNWREAVAKIELHSSGGAVAKAGAHKVAFAPNVNSHAAVVIATPDGKKLRTHVVGLAYYDFKKKQSVLIAEVKDSLGTIVGENQLIYSDAFTDFQADIRYTYTLDGFEQDVILRERPPLPEEFGLDPRSTWMELWTEFTNPPDPIKQKEIRKRWQKATFDKCLDFGSMKIGPGAAFGIGAGGDRYQGVPVQKHWLTTADQRTFLIEEVSFRWSVPQLRALPEPQVAIPKHQLRQVASTRLFPEGKTASTGPSDGIRTIAKVDEKAGFVIDYAIVQTSEDFVFQGDTTYYVSGNVNLSGTTRIEGGTVIKYADGVSMSILGPLECATEAYRPAVLTSHADNSVGEEISAGPPSGTAANVALALSEYANLRYLHFRYANKAIHSLSDYDVSHSHFLHCNKAIQIENANFTARNILMHNVQNAFYGRFYHGVVEHLTYDQGTEVTADWDFYPGQGCAAPTPASSSITMVNSLLTRVGTWGIVPVGKVAVRWLGNAEWPFKTAGGAGYYLLEGSPYRNLGVTGINGDLAQDLKQKTTHAPLVYSNVTISVDRTLGPRVKRDTDKPDLGYHYDPLDYAFGGVSSQANLTFEAGTAVGWFRTSSGYYHAGHGITLGDTKIARFNGLAERPNYWVRCNVVQEESTGLWEGGYGAGGMTGWADQNSENISLSPEAHLRFTRCSMLAEPANHFRDDWGYLIVRGKDSEFYGGSLGAYVLSAYLTNCLLFRCSLVQVEGHTGNELFVRNCTWLGGALIFNRSLTEIPISVKDCAFDGTVFSVRDDAYNNQSATEYGYNAFLESAPDSGPEGRPMGVGDVSGLNAFDWETSFFGNYYLPENSPLIDVGSRSASSAALYHFCTTSTQDKEASSQVDIGYHYVAAPSGLPVDTDGDGMFDYFEDQNGNGNGADDPTSWQTYNSPNGLSSGNGLQVFTPLR